jgi:hypothetical protein
MIKWRADGAERLAAIVMKLRHGRKRSRAREVRGAVTIPRTFEDIADLFQARLRFKSDDAIKLVNAHEITPNDARMLAEMIVKYMTTVSLDKAGSDRLDFVLLAMLHDWYERQAAQEGQPADAGLSDPDKGDSVQEVAKAVESALAKHERSRWLLFIEGIIVGLVTNGVYDALSASIGSLFNRAPTWEAQIWTVEHDVGARVDRWMASVPSMEEFDETDRYTALWFTLHALSMLTFTGQVVVTDEGSEDMQ